MADLISRWKEGLSRSSKAAFGRLAGLGERADDLQPFDPDAFVNGILGL